ncbi:hypothetical protein Tco_0533529 [Tanacetum coccineum]
MHYEEFAQRLSSSMQAELEEEDRLVRQREEEANIVSWDNVQAMIDADYQMAQQMQAEEQEKLNDEDDVTIDATPLSTKSPTIVEYKIYKERKKSYF